MIIFGNELASKKISLGFNFRVGHIGCSIANSSPPLWHFERSCVTHKRNDAEIGALQTRHMFRRNLLRIVKVFCMSPLNKFSL